MSSTNAVTVGKSTAVARVNVSLEPQAWAGLDRGDLVTLVVALEQAGAASVLLVDPAVTGASGVWRWDAPTAAAALAGATSSVGLIITVSTSFTDPFTASRLVGSLDHYTNGRAGWLLDPGDDPSRRAKTRAVTPVFRAGDPAGRAAELVEAARSLWDGWQESAFVADRARRSIIDRDKIAASNFAGEYFRVAGPSTLRRPPGGNPPVFVRITDDASVRLAATVADVALVPLEQTASVLPALLAGSQRAVPLAVLGSVALADLDVGQSLGKLAQALERRDLAGVDLVISSPTEPAAVSGAVASVIGVPPDTHPGGPGLRGSYGLPALRS
jgi:alkanesulfonate monooxygenase SsuD/methylene tetrahydromethanopterin reductase-like flavin-dependent oxidoreductase (luciferase family)